MCGQSMIRWNIPRIEEAVQPLIAKPSPERLLVAPMPAMGAAIVGVSCSLVLMHACRVQSEDQRPNDRKEKNTLFRNKRLLQYSTGVTVNIKSCHRYQTRSLRLQGPAPIWVTHAESQWPQAHLATRIWTATADSGGTWGSTASSVVIRGSCFTRPQGVLSA